MNLTRSFLEKNKAIVIMAMEADNTLAGDLFGEMVMEQAIKDKTEQVEAEMAAAQEAQATGFYLNNEDERKHEMQDSDEDPDFAMTEDEEKMMRQMKEDRIAAARDDYTEHRENVIRGGGTYTEIVEQEFLPAVTETDYVIVSFFHKDFERCKIIDMHLHKICKSHPEARFVRIDAEKCPFFVAKLNVQMLPTLVLFENGIAIGRIVGFEELGGEDDFPTMNLVRLLVKGGVLIPKNKSECGQIRMKRAVDDDGDCSDD